MTTFRTGPRLTVATVALAVGLAGCGGGGGGQEAATSGAPGVTESGTTAVRPSATDGSPEATSFRTLANAVCRAEVSDVPPVPDARKADAAATERYAAAVERAAEGLADAFVLLERRRPESQDALAPLVTKARAVARSADRTEGATAGSGSEAADAGGFQDEIRVTIARLNEASSAAGLPTCAL